VTVYLSLKQILDIHDQQLQLFGGSAGLRERGLLESALARSAMTFGGEDLYPDIAAKAAALMHSLALNRPFVDGNKRVAAHAAILFVMSNDYELLADSADVFAIAMAVAEGNIEVEALTVWFRQRLRSQE
jgi:death-on-curing protein